MEGFFYESNALGAYDFIEFCEGFNKKPLLNIKIPKEVEEIINKLEEKDFRAYVVGGAVRNLLLNKEPKDWDICTNAIPEQVKETFKDYPVIETGIKHGTVSVVINKIPYEITTFRTEGEYLDGRHPSFVTFVENLKEDLSRRDFTINAMALNIKNQEVLDAFSGLEDIEKKVIKCVGNPEERFLEDGLRILRAIRFAAQLDFKIEKETKKAIFEEKELLKRISKERIMSEITKILQSSHGEDYILEYGEIFCELFKMRLHKVETGEDWVLKLGKLLVDNSEEVVEKNLRELKFDNETIKLVKGIIGCLHSQEKNIKILTKDFGEEVVSRLYPTEFEKIEKPYLIKHLEINGNDLMEMGLEGKEVGETLEKILLECIKDPNLNKKEVLLNLCKKNL